MCAPALLQPSLAYDTTGQLSTPTATEDASPFVAATLGTPAAVPQQHHAANQAVSSTDPSSSSLSAKAVVDCLLEHVTVLTTPQRAALEANNQQPAADKDAFMLELACLPGKLDHASVVAYKVGKAIKGLGFMRSSEPLLHKT